MYDFSEFDVAAGVTDLLYQQEAAEDADDEERAHEPIYCSQPTSQDDLKSEIAGRQRAGCGCSTNHYAALDTGPVYHRILSMRELTNLKAEQDLYIIYL